MRQSFLLVTVWAAMIAATPLRFEDEPKRCCTGMKWETNGTLLQGFVLNNTPMAQTIDGKIIFDATTNRVAIDGTQHIMGRDQQLRVVQDYNTHTQYSILAALRYCKVEPLQQPMMMRCIPDDATFVRYRMLGDPKTPLKVSEWNFKYNEGSTKLDITMTVTDAGCSPVTQQLQGNIGSIALVSTMIMSDFRAKISNPKVFYIPEYCKTVASNTMKGSNDVTF